MAEKVTKKPYAKNKEESEEEFELETDSSDTDCEPDSASDEEDLLPSKCSNGFDMGNGACGIFTGKKHRFNRRSSKKRRGPLHRRSLSRMTGLRTKSNTVPAFFPDIVLDIDSEWFSTHPEPKIILFYSPGCGFCRRFKHVYQNVANQLKDKLPLYAMDCTASDTFVTQQHFNIDGYPTVVYSPSPTSMDFQVYPLLGQVDDDIKMEDLQKWIVSKMKISESFLGVKSSRFFTNKNIIELNAKTFHSNRYPDPKIVLFYDPDCHYCQEFEPIYSELCSKLKHVLFYALDASNPQNESICSMYNIACYPTLACILGKMDIRIFSGERSMKKVEKWISSMMNTSTRSTKRMSNRSYSGEKEIIPSNLKELRDTPDVKDMTDLLHSVTGAIMFYAPWCGHCVKMKPDYISAAKEMPMITFYMVNGDASEKTSLLKQHYEINGFPTIFWVKDGKKVEKSDFQKERTKEMIKEWATSFNNK